MLSLIFLLKLNVSCLFRRHIGPERNPRLKSLKINKTEKLWHASQQAKYPIDGVLRIGGIPTFRFWRDLEEKKYSFKVCSVSDVAFSGLSWGEILCAPLASFFNGFIPKRNYPSKNCQSWIKSDQIYTEQIENLCLHEPLAEPSIFYKLSKNMPQIHGYIWAIAFQYANGIWPDFRENDGHFSLQSRGLNGIDGQISTFLGLSRPGA